MIHDKKQMDNQKHLVIQINIYKRHNRANKAIAK